MASKAAPSMENQSLLSPPSHWRMIQQDSPVDSYMQSQSMQPTYGSGYDDQFYSSSMRGMGVGIRDNDVYDLSYSVGPSKLPQPLALTAVPPSSIVDKTSKLFPIVQAPPPATSSAKVDQYINSILEGTPKTEQAAQGATPIAQAEIISFLDSQFRVALDPLLINSIASLPSTEPVLSNPKLKKKKRKQCEPQDLEPEIERELAKYPTEEREKQRKILKNRLAARTFRRRQKEHISEMSSQIDSLTEENVKLRSALKLMAMENKMIKEQLGYIKSFLAPFGALPNPGEAAVAGAPVGSRPYGQQHHQPEHLFTQHQHYLPQHHQPYQRQHPPYAAQHPVQYPTHRYAVAGQPQSVFPGEFNEAGGLQPEAYFN